MPEIDAWLHQAHRLHQQGDLPAAETLYRRILAERADHANALYLLGTLHYQQGNLGSATLFLRKATKIDPDHGDALNNLGLVQQRQGKLEEAAGSYRRTLELRPEHVSAWFNLGNVLKEQGKLTESVANYRQALTLKPRYVEAYENLALALLAKEDLCEALASCNRALELAPDLSSAHNTHGAILSGQQEYEQATGSFEKAIALKPDFAEAHGNLGSALLFLERYQEAEDASERARELDPSNAINHKNLGLVKRARAGEAEKSGKDPSPMLSGAFECFRQALQLKPDLSEIYHMSIEILIELGRLEEAEHKCRQDLESRPQDTSIHIGLGILLQYAGKDAEAAEQFRQAISIDSQLVNAHIQLGQALNKMGNPIQAYECFQKAIELDPDSIDALRRMGTLLLENGRVQEAREKYLAAARSEPENLLAKFRAETLCPELWSSNEEIDRYRANLTELLEAHLPSDLGLTPVEIITADFRPVFNLPFQGRDDRPIKESFAKFYDPYFPKETPALGTGLPRIGFVVTRGHEFAFEKSIGGLFEFFSPDAFRPTILCTKPAAEMLASKIRNPRVEYFVLPIRQLAAIEAIRRGGFDLLYYWEIGTDNFNYFLPYFRTAPIQCTSWGIQVTSGIGAIDHYISSELIEPDDADCRYTEKLLRLKTMLAYPTRTPRPETYPSRDDFGLPEGRHLYLCPQQLGKFHPDFDEILGMILREDPHGTLVITRGKRPALEEILRKRFESTIPEVTDQILFIPSQRGKDYFGLLMHADVMLDPIHFGGVNTSYDGFSLGKAIVTLPSQLHRGRYTLGCYRRMGIEDCIASSPQEYAQLAVRIASETDSKKSIEEKILASSILFENAETARELQECLVKIVEEARKKQ